MRIYFHHFSFVVTVIITVPPTTVHSDKNVGMIVATVICYQSIYLPSWHNLFENKQYLGYVLSGNLSYFKTIGQQRTQSSGFDIREIFYKTFILNRNIIFRDECMELTWHQSICSQRANRCQPCKHQGPFRYHGLTLIPVWIINYIHYNAWDEIIYPFPNFTGCSVKVSKWIINFIPHFTRRIITYPCWD